MDSTDGAMRDRPGVGDASRRGSSAGPASESATHSDTAVRMHRAWFEQLAADRYGVFVGARQVGFIDVDGPLHVALRGSDYETAVEVDRAIRFDQALRALLAA